MMVSKYIADREIIWIRFEMELNNVEMKSLPWSHIIIICLRRVAGTSRKHI